jgi:hypothetical protein
MGGRGGSGGGEDHPDCRDGGEDPDASSAIHAVGPVMANHEMQSLGGA